MDFKGILTNFFQLIYIGLSIYGSIDPRAKWVGPVATTLAGLTSTPQSTLKPGDSSTLLKCITIIITGSFSIFNLLR